MAGSSLCCGGGRGEVGGVTSKPTAIPHLSLCAFCVREEADGGKKSQVGNKSEGVAERFLNTPARYHISFYKG